MDNDSLFDRQVTQEAALLLDGRAAEVENMKTQLKDQVKTVMNQSFVSAGNLEKKESLPTITFLKRNDTVDADDEVEAEY